MNLINFFNGITVFELIYIITVAFAIILVVQQKGDPLKTISWILVIILIPIAGIGLYFFFGQNYRRQKIFSRKEVSDIEHLRGLNTYISKKLLRKSTIKSKQRMMTLLENNSKSLLTQNNNVEIYFSGKEAFDQILSDFEKARHHIHVEYYIIEDDKIGKRVQEMLIKKALQGVIVRVIYDDVGSWSLPKKYTNSLHHAGVEIHPFLPVKFPLLTNKINYRNHRKIIVIDGTIGYVGGMNIADRYLEGNAEVGQWRDAQLRIEGDSAHSLQAIFLTDWYFASKKIINSEIYFPPHNIHQEHVIQITASGPDSDWASIMQSYFVAITTAEKYIYIASPYFIPNESILTALKTAALSGVEVRIMLPYKSDSHIVFRSTLSFVSELLEAGIHVHFYNNGFNHSKLIIVDGVIASVGTANMDIRSFDQNFEVNALIYDEEITKVLEDNFKEDMKSSVEFTLSEWENRPWIDNQKEILARLLSPLF